MSRVIEWVWEWDSERESESVIWFPAFVWRLDIFSSMRAIFDQDQVPKSCIIWHIKCWVPIRKNSGARLDFRTVTYAKYWKITVYWTPANQDTLTGHARRVPWLYLLFAVIFPSSRRPKWTEEKPPIPVRLIQVWSRTGQAAKRLGYRKLRTNCFSREETGNLTVHYSTSTQAITDMCTVRMWSQLLRPLSNLNHSYYYLNTFRK